MLPYGTDKPQGPPPSQVELQPLNERQAYSTRLPGPDTTPADNFTVQHRHPAHRRPNMQQNRVTAPTKTKRQHAQPEHPEWISHTRAGRLHAKDHPACFLAQVRPRLHTHMVKGSRTCGAIFSAAPILMRAVSNEHTFTASRAGMLFPVSVHVPPRHTAPQPKPAAASLVQCCLGYSMVAPPQGPHVWRYHVADQLRCTCCDTIAGLPEQSNA